MRTWFLCKAKYQKINDQGKQVNAIEHYLVDAVTFTEAESRINEELEPYISGEFFVTAVKISNISDIIESEADYYYKTKVSLIVLNEEFGIEKRKNIYYIVQADNILEAYGYLKNSLSDVVSEYEIMGIVKTQILDIFKYEKEQNVILEDES